MTTDDGQSERVTDGEVLERRRSSDVAVVEMLAKVHEGMLAVASSISGLTAGLIASVSSQGDDTRAQIALMRRWVKWLTVAVGVCTAALVLLVGMAILNYPRIRENNDTSKLLNECLFVPDSECAKVSNARSQAALEQNRQEMIKLSDEIKLCVAAGRCVINGTTTTSGTTTTTAPPP